MSEMGKKTKGKGTDINAAQRAALAVKLRAAKFTYDQIAAQCGYASRGACYNAVQREMRRVVVDNVEELRREELFVLDLLHQTCYKRMEDNEYASSKMFAVDRILAIMERRARLMNLDIKPEEVASQQNYIKKIVVVTGEEKHD